MTDQARALGPRPAVPRWRKLLPLLGLVLLGFVLSRLDLGGMAAAFGRISTGTIAAASALFALNFALKTLRWQRMLRAQGIALPAEVAWAAFMSAQFYAQVTVGRVGEFFRVEALLARGVSAGAALASSLFDRLLDLFVVLLVGGGLAALVLGDRRVAGIALALMLAVAFGLRALLAALGAERSELAERWLRRFQPRPWLARLVQVARDMARGIRPLVAPGPLSEALLWTCLGWACYFGTLFELAHGLGLRISSVLLTATAAFAALSTLLPITISGLGARELIYIGVLGQHGVPAESAAVLSLLHLFVMMGTTTALGLAGVAWRQRQPL